MCRAFAAEALNTRPKVALAACATAMAFNFRRGRRIALHGGVDREVNKRSTPDEEFPWSFTGRVRFRPALVHTTATSVAPGVQAVSVFGLTLGGSVCLEYDTSPVGSYVEVVQMAAVVFSERFWTAALWGCRLMVSTDEADSANGNLWGVPSERCDITFEEGGYPSINADAFGRLTIGGWGGMRFAAEGGESWGPLPIWWTPTLKALWLPLSPWRDDTRGGTLPLRQLRLSAAAVRLQWAPAAPGGEMFVGGGLEDKDAYRIPLPVVLEADGVLIEIGKVFDQL